MCRDYNEKNLKKICSKCGIEKPISEFYHKKTGKYGVCGQCKKCKRIIDDEYIKNNPDKVRKYKDKWVANNRGKRLEVSKKYYYRNRDKHMVLTRNRRARMQNAEGKFSHKQWEEIKKKYDYRCAICGKKEPFNQYRKMLTIDHIIPLSKGGTNYIDNIQPLCFICNSVKKDKVQGIVRTLGKPKEISRND